MRKLNEAAVRGLPVPATGNKLHHFTDAVVSGSQVPRGLCVRVTANGVRAFVLRYFLAGRERLVTIGRWPDWSAIAAVREARELRQRIDRGEDPLAARAKATAIERNTLRSVVETYLEREGGRLRSADRQRQTFERLVYPELGDRPIDGIRRGDVVRLLDQIEDKSGPVMADRTLAILRRVLSWHAVRHDDFASPIIRGMSRTKPKERARSRTLSDAEIRAVWEAAEGAGVFGNLVRFLLTTGARRTEAAAARWGEIAGSHWLLPAARNKAKVDLVRPLSALALAALPDRGAGPFVFSTDHGRTPFSGFSKSKRRLDQASGVVGWRLHDLRRTARSLMSRAGVNADHAERALGHAMPTIRGVYDRWQFLDEKAAAFEALGNLLDQIVHPRDNVEPIRRAR